MDVILGDYAPKGLNIRGKIAALEGRPRLGSQQESVAYGNPYPFIADIQRHNSHILMIQPGVHRAIMVLLLVFWRLY